MLSENPEEKNRCKREPKQSWSDVLDWAPGPWAQMFHLREARKTGEKWMAEVARRPHLVVCMLLVTIGNQVEDPGPQTAGFFAVTDRLGDHPHSGFFDSCGTSIPITP